MKHKKLAKVETPPLLKQSLGGKLKKSDNLYVLLPAMKMQSAVICVGVLFRITTSTNPESSRPVETSTNFTMLLPKEPESYKKPKPTVIQQKKPVSDILNDLDDSLFESSSFLESVDKIVVQATQKPVACHKKVEKGEFPAD